jgi:hypothetical protein
MTATETARCPNCKAHISLWQAAWYGIKRPFKCRKCGRLLKKDSTRILVVMTAVTGMTWFGSRNGVANPETWLMFAAGCLAVTVDAYAFTKIKLSDAAFEATEQ